MLQRLDMFRAEKGFGVFRIFQSRSNRPSGLPVFGEHASACSRAGAARVRVGPGPRRLRVAFFRAATLLPSPFHQGSPRFSGALGVSSLRTSRTPVFWPGGVQRVIARPRRLPAEGRRARSACVCPVRGELFGRPRRDAAGSRASRSPVTERSPEASISVSRFAPPRCDWSGRDCRGVRWRFTRADDKLDCSGPKSSG